MTYYDHNDYLHRSYENKFHVNQDCSQVHVESSNTFDYIDTLNSKSQVINILLLEIRT